MKSILVKRGLIGLVILAALVMALKAYGDARFREGRKVEEQAWLAAQNKLLKAAANSASEADKQALAVTLEHDAKVLEEKEKVDDAINDGSSPFDVLFPAS